MEVLTDLDDNGDKWGYGDDMLLGVIAYVVMGVVKNLMVVIFG